MKRILKLSSLMLVVSVILMSCEKVTTAGVSSQTNYPEFEMSGDALILHQLGTTFVDPGVKAYEAGNEIPVISTINGIYRGGVDVDGMTADKYIITYSATNKDGFSGTVTREVWVAGTGDLTTSIEGLYSVTCVRNGAASPEYESMEYTLVWKNADGTYDFSDGIGGYYSLGRGYGDSYVAPGANVTANDIPSNDFTVTAFTVMTFGGVCTMSALTATPGSGELSWSTNWDVGYDFVCTGTQIAI